MRNYRETVSQTTGKAEGNTRKGKRHRLDFPQKKRRKRAGQLEVNKPQPLDRLGPT
jgi:hypothetical protein